MAEAGTIIADRYRLEHLIGEGGMGLVWLATHIELETEVAVKFVDAVGPNASRHAERFLREAKIAARVKHPGVVRVLDFGRCQFGPYMAMELLRGETLEARMLAGPMSQHALLDVIERLLAGLCAVHSEGILHRDIKPSNIVFELEGDVVYPKLVDFGLGKVAHGPGASASTTRDGLVAGTPDYMSPEQARALDDLDARSDLYSVGVVMYEALTGRVPFCGDTPADVLTQKLTHEAPDLLRYRPRVTPCLARLVAKAVARDS